MTFGETIKTQRTKKGWTAKQLAEKLSNPVVCSYITKIELHNEIPSPKMLKNIASALGVNMSKLIDIAKREKLEQYKNMLDKKYNKEL